MASNTLISHFPLSCITCFQTMLLFYILIPFEKVIFFKIKIMKQNQFMLKESEAILLSEKSQDQKKIIIISYFKSNSLAIFSDMLQQN